MEKKPTSQEHNKLFTKQNIQLKTTQFLASRKHANNLVDILRALSHRICKEQNFKTCILALERMLGHALASGFGKKQPTEQTSEAEQQYREWLILQYEAVMEELLVVMSEANLAVKVKEQALVTYMKLLEKDSLYITKPKHGSDICLPRNKFVKLLKVIISDNKFEVNRRLLMQLRKYCAFHDVALQIWGSATQLTVMKPDKPHSEARMKSILMLLQQTPIPKSDLRKKEPDQILFPKRGGSWSIKGTDKALKQHVDEVWNHIRHWAHVRATLQSTLLLLLEKLMAHLSNPILLTDFFMTSLESGGAISVLSLQGIFQLIQKHNIEYPNIYDKLYSLFTPDLFKTPYKSRLFFLADIFLTSTHIPEALVASFAKRLARLALLAPASDILIILPFIGNLLIRHKGLQILINHPIGNSVDSDPFRDQEPDPMKTCAMDSSLWEIKSLKTHLIPAVATTASKLINEKVPTVESDLSDALEGAYEQILQKEKSRKVKDVAMTFIRPSPNRSTRDLKLKSLMWQARKCGTVRVQNPGIPEALFKKQMNILNKSRYFKETARRMIILNSSEK